MRKVLKWIGIVVGGLIGLVVLLVGVAYAVTGIRMGKVYHTRKEEVQISTDTMTIERGRHIATALSKCGDCHGADYGGKIVIDDPMLGRLAGPNLTGGKGSVTKDFTDRDWVRAIRHGIKPDGTPLVIMPSNEFWYHDDDDLAALISYVKSVPPVDRIIPETKAGPIFRLFALFGQVDLLPAADIDHSGRRPKPPEPGPTVEYGRHLAMTGGCISCHGPGLSGGAIPGTPPDWPPAGNLTPEKATGIGNWSEADFIHLLTTGKRPDGRQLDPERMPWKATAEMKDYEMRAIWLYLRTIPSQPKGNR